MRFGQMHGDNFSQVLMRALVSTRAARKQLEESKTLPKISSVEFGLCGGKRKKNDSTEYSLQRQLVLAERGLRSFVNGEQEIFDSDIKQTAKKQMKEMIQGMKSWLDDDLPGWDNSDDEDVDNHDITESANDSESAEEEGEEENEEREEEEEGDEKDESEEDDDKSASHDSPSDSEDEDDEEDDEPQDED